MATDDTITGGVAGRYASALFDLAQEANQVRQVEKDLISLQSLLNESADLKRMVRSPVFSSDEQGRATLVDTSSDAVVKKTRQRLRFSYDDEPAGMSWVQIEGDVKSLEGSWEFVELAAERTEATFALAVDPGRVLGMLLRGPVEGKVKEFLTKGAAEGLKEHVESAAGG